jgi:hypothetical protein
MAPVSRSIRRSSLKSRPVIPKSRPVIPNPAPVSLKSRLACPIPPPLRLRLGESLPPTSPGQSLRSPVIPRLRFDRLPANPSPSKLRLAFCPLRPPSACLIEWLPEPHPCGSIPAPLQLRCTPSSASAFPPVSAINRSLWTGRCSASALVPRTSASGAFIFSARSSAQCRVVDRCGASSAPRSAAAWRPSVLSTTGH